MYKISDRGENKGKGGGKGSYWTLGKDLHIRQRKGFPNSNFLHVEQQSFPFIYIIYLPE